MLIVRQLRDDVIAELVQDPPAGMVGFAISCSHVVQPYLSLHYHLAVDGSTGAPLTDEAELRRRAVAGLLVFETCGCGPRWWMQHGQPHTLDTLRPEGEVTILDSAGQRN